VSRRAKVLVGVDMAGVLMIGDRVGCLTTKARGRPTAPVAANVIVKSPELTGKRRASGAVLFRLVELSSCSRPLERAWTPRRLHA